MKHRAAHVSVAALFLAASGAAPEADDVPSDAKLEFLHDPVNEIYEAKDGKVHLGLGNHSRRFEIDPEVSPDADEMIAFAKRAKRSGESVHATVWLRKGVPKRKDPRTRTGVFPLVVRLAADADPRKRATR